MSRCWDNKASYQQLRWMVPGFELNATASLPAALGTRTGVCYEKRDRLHIAAPPSGTLGARLLVFEAQTD
jgi:hypothetical protein